MQLIGCHTFRYRTAYENQAKKKKHTKCNENVKTLKLSEQPIIMLNKSRTSVHFGTTHSSQFHWKLKYQMFAISSVGLQFTHANARASASSSVHKFDQRNRFMNQQSKRTKTPINLPILYICLQTVFPHLLFFSFSFLFFSFINFSFCFWFCLLLRHAHSLYLVIDCCVNIGVHNTFNPHMPHTEPMTIFQCGPWPICLHCRCLMFDIC